MPHQYVSPDILNRTISVSFQEIQAVTRTSSEMNHKIITYIFPDISTSSKIASIQKDHLKLKKKKKKKKKKTFNEHATKHLSIISGLYT